MSEKAEEKKLNLWQKIHAVMTDVEYLSKDGEIKFGNTKYNAITETKVTSTVRASLVKHGLVILPVEQSHRKEGNLSTVDVLYKIIDIDTGDSETVASSGTGADTQDKGVGKAMTYSFKYMLLRAFSIPTGEDPDKIASAELDEQMKPKPIKQKQLGVIKSRVMKFADLRSKKPGDVYEAVNLTEEKLSKLTEDQALDLIEKLDGWIKKADDEKLAKEKKEQGA